MHPYRTEVRAAAADWQRIATAAIHARTPIGQQAANLLVAAIDSRTIKADTPGPLPDVRKVPITFPTHAAYADVQTWRKTANLTWPQAIHVAALLTSNQ